MLAYLLAILIGVSLGLVGGGGSILTVPVLVYLFDVEPVTATTYSLFIVGITSLVGGVKAYTKKLIDFRAVALFGIPSILSIFIARQFILPAIPDFIGDIGGFRVTKSMLLMVIFAILMFTAAISMIRKDIHRDRLVLSDSRDPNLFLILPGLIIGLVTGLLGAGGGFLIIPTLVLIIHMPMKAAVGTSLLIIAINSIFGFVFSIGQHYLDWKLLLLFTILAIGGIFIGSRLSDRISSAFLKQAFGWFVMVMGTYILVKELWQS